MKDFFAFLALIPFLNLRSQTTHYNPTCEIRDGRAYGFIDNYRDAITVDGTVWFYFFDCNGTFIASEDEYEYEYVSKGAREEIEYTAAPQEACSCQFLPQEAIQSPNVQPDPVLPNANLIPSCELREGKAFGYLVSPRQPVTVDGNVLFYFYDCQGTLIGTEDEYEFEYVSKGEREEIEYTRAPKGACSCYFDVTGALK